MSLTLIPISRQMHPFHVFCVDCWDRLSEFAVPRWPSKLFTVIMSSLYTVVLKSVCLLLILKLHSTLSLLQSSHTKTVSFSLHCISFEINCVRECTNLIIQNTVQKTDFFFLCMLTYTFCKCFDLKGRALCKRTQRLVCRCDFVNVLIHC